MPVAVPWALSHDETAGPPAPLYTKLISLRLIPWQGNEALQFKVTAATELEVPLMLLNVTSLICTELAYKTKESVAIM